MYFLNQLFFFWGFIHIDPMNRDKISLENGRNDCQKIVANSVQLNKHQVVFFHEEVAIDHHDGCVLQGQHLVFLQLEQIHFVEEGRHSVRRAAVDASLQQFLHGNPVVHKYLNCAGRIPSGLGTFSLTKKSKENSEFKVIFFLNQSL